jgi:hypothetical protein
MSFQKCPVCYGTGVSPLPGTYSNIPVCPVCRGQRIISEVTGNPPTQNSTLKLNQDGSNIQSRESQV